MVDIVRIPQLGLSDYGDLVAWEAEIGERVSKGQVLATLESEKASAEIEASADGVLLETFVQEGDEIAIDVGTPLAVIGEEEEEAPPLEEIESGGNEDTPEASSDERDETSAEADEGNASEEVKATPRARRRASEEEDLDLQDIQGTGPQNAITEDDIEQYLERDDEEEKEETKTESATGSSELTVAESRELSTTRKTIAERLSRSAREKPHVMGTREVSIKQLERFQERLNKQYDIQVSQNDIILYLVGRVLQDLPEFNAHFEEETHKIMNEVNIGYAVEGQQGLVVPVIKDAEKRSLTEMAEERGELVERVLENDHSSDDIQGGTFTVTNVGVFDMDVSYSIINPPEVAILAVGRRKYAPVERDGDVEFEKVMTFSLTIDHRVLDGADSGRFLDQLAEYVEYPGVVLDSL